MEHPETFTLENEFDLLEIGTQHNKKRFDIIMENMLKNPMQTILSQSRSRSEAKAAYQFLNNENLDMDAIKETHRFRTLERIVELKEPILLVQDTTYVDYHSQAKKEGKSKISPTTTGVKIHTSLALTQAGLSLGVLSQSSSHEMNDDDEVLSEHQLKTRPIEEKESYRWIDAFRKSMLMMPDDIDVTVISDREGDIYEYMATVVASKRHFLMRIAQNRLTTENEKVLDSIRKTERKGQVVVQVPRNTATNQAARKATLDLHYKEYEIIRPAHLNKVENLQGTITVSVVYAVETKPPVGSEKIEWFLMTNRRITSTEMAEQQLANYTQRWKIERFHYVLKSGGCKIDKIQARTMKVTMIQIMLYSIISVFIMNLTYMARLYPDAPCTIFFDDDEWKFLYSITNKTSKIPDKPISIKEAVKLIAQIGSGKRAPSDGDPGLKAIWKGLEKFFLLFDYKENIQVFLDYEKLTVQV
jgi:hypothetical protein